MQQSLTAGNEGPRTGVATCSTGLPLYLRVTADAGTADNIMTLVFWHIDVNLQHSTVSDQGLMRACDCSAKGAMKQVSSAI